MTAVNPDLCSQGIVKKFKTENWLNFPLDITLCLTPSNSSLLEGFSYMSDDNNFHKLVLNMSNNHSRSSTYALLTCMLSHV